MDREELIGLRAAGLSALGVSAQAPDVASVLIAVNKQAIASGDEEFSRALRPQIQAALAHASAAGMPERPARFTLIANPLRESETLAQVAEFAKDPLLPPLARAHFFDLVWSLEPTPRAHPQAARDATEAYLAYDAAANELPKAESDTAGWARLSDALARSCELARESAQVDLAQRAAAAVRRRLEQADAAEDFRIVIEPTRALLELTRLVPTALEGVASVLERARAKFTAEKKFILARGVITLEIDVARATGRMNIVNSLKRESAESYVSEASAREPLVASHFIEQAVRALEGLPDSRERVAELTRQLEATNRAAAASMATVSGHVSLPSADVERFYEAFTSAPTEDALGLMGDHFLLDRAREYERHDKNASRLVFTNLVTHTLLTEYGETLTFSPGTPEHRDYMVFRQAVQGMVISGVFIQEIFARLRAGGLDADDVVAYLSACPFFSESSRALISDGVRRIFVDDHVGAVHVLVPQLEAAIRGLVQAAGLPITRVREQTSEMLLLGGLLKALRTSQVLEDRYVFSFEVALDRLGWNIRNRVAHGWITAADCTPTVSLRLLQLFLAIGLLRPADQAADPGGVRQ